MMHKNIYFKLIFKANFVRQQKISVLVNTYHSSVLSMMPQNPLHANACRKR